MGIVDDLSHSNTWWEIFRTGFNPIPGIFLPQQSYAFHSPAILYLTLIQPHLLPLKQENLIIFHKCVDCEQSLFFFRFSKGSAHARASGEAARRAKRGRQPLPSRAISLARGHLRVSRFARRTTEKRETARSLTNVERLYEVSLWNPFFALK